MAAPKPNSGVMDIAAYVPGKSAVPEGVKLHTLSANETPLGPSRRARDAVADLADLSDRSGISQALPAGWHQDADNSGGIQL